MEWFFFIAFALWLVVPWRTIVRRQQEERARRINALADQLCRAIEKLEIRVIYSPEPSTDPISTKASSPEDTQSLQAKSP